MAEENKGQEPEQEQVPEQVPEPGEEPAGEPEEAQQEETPAKEKGEGLLMPILYALLAGVGAFTLALIIGIVLTFFFRPLEDPSETPSGEQSSQVTLTPAPTQTPAPTPDGEDGGEETETPPPQGSDGEDGEDADTDADTSDAPE